MVSHRRIYNYITLRSFLISHNIEYLLRKTRYLIQCVLYDHVRDYLLNLKKRKQLIKGQSRHDVAYFSGWIEKVAR